MDLDYFLSQSESNGAARQTLDFDKNPSVLLVFAANRFTRSSARYYQKHFAIGAMDWRVLVMLTSEPNIPAARIAKVIGIDKAAVSRSLARLQSKKLAIANIPKGDARRKTWTLSKKGSDLHDQILQVALARQRQLLAGFSQSEILQINDLLNRMLHNIGALD